MTESKSNAYELIRQKQIIQILIGDGDFEEVALDSGEQFHPSMPYLSGQDLCDLCTMFGLPMTYTWGGSNLSRWEYLSKLLEHCIHNGTCSSLLNHLFSKKQFKSVIDKYPLESIGPIYLSIVDIVIEKINCFLYFGGNELIKIGSNYIIKSVDSKANVQLSEIKTIDNDYIKSISDRAIIDIEQGNFDSAITKSRTLLEEVFCYVIEKKGDTPSNKGNISKLYTQVKKHYNMHADKDADVRINTLLSGLEKIISAISEIRNKDSDSHGIGSKRITIKEHHATLLVNSSMVMANFILAIEKNNKQ